MKPELTRRKILGGVASLGILGAGVTAQTGLDGASISGSADVQAEQALTITDVNIVSPADDSTDDTDASFTRVSDDNTEYGVAAELNNGDSFGVEHTIGNSSQSDLPVQLNIECSDELTVGLENGDSSEAATGPVKSGNNTFVAKLSGASSPGNTHLTELDLSVELADTADPGAYDVSVAINPLSGGDSSGGSA